jgi:uncharacterized membrane protein YidH (DUF202 family)
MFYPNVAKRIFMTEKHSEQHEINDSNQTLEPDSLIINEAKLILAEKRTSLAAVRTGIAVIALPLSVVGLLIATSRYYDVLHVLHLIIPLSVLLLALIALGGHLIIRAMGNIHRHDRLIRQLKAGHSGLSEFLD